MLYLVATPIGNLGDITLRAIETLKQVDYILCEDTRHSSTLLKHYQIDTPLKSYHKFSEAKKEDAIIQDLQNGKNIALISDAGTPAISDPGSRLVASCRELNIDVSSIPGPCAAISALACSGIPTDQFQFVGFLPKKQGELSKALMEIMQYAHTTVCYESPERINKVLEQIAEIDPDRKIAVARELTKKFEEIATGLASDLKSKTFKGEIVLIIHGASSSFADFSHLTPEEHVAELQKTYNLTKKEAVKAVASLRNVCKRTLYKSV